MDTPAQQPSSRHAAGLPAHARGRAGPRHGRPHLLLRARGDAQRQLPASSCGARAQSRRRAGRLQGSDGLGGPAARASEARVAWPHPTARPCQNGLDLKSWLRTAALLEGQAPVVDCSGHDRRRPVTNRDQFFIEKRRDNKNPGTPSETHGMQHRTTPERSARSKHWYTLLRRAQFKSLAVSHWP